jgi:nitrate reductase gamma subunit
MHFFLFGILPYIAVSIAAMGSIARYERDPATWKSSSSQLLRRKQLILGSILFHLGVLTIFVGHVFGLLLPVELYDALGVGHSFKQALAAIGGGLAGVMALIGGLLLAHRRFLDPRVRASSSRADNAIILVLIAQLVLGLATVPLSLAHLDGHEMVNLMNWANGIATFDGAAASYITHTALVFKLHIFLGLVIFILFPFTRLVHMLSAPVRYLWRPGYQIVRSRKGRRS